MLDFKYEGAFICKLFRTYIQDVIFTLGMNGKQGHFKCYSQAINYLYIRKDLDNIFLFDWKSTNLSDSNISRWGTENLWLPWQLTLFYQNLCTWKWPKDIHKNKRIRDYFCIIFSLSVLEELMQGNTNLQIQLIFIFFQKMDAFCYLGIFGIFPSLYKSTKYLT